MITYFIRGGVLSFLFASFIFLTSCSPRETLERFAGEENLAMADQLISASRQGDLSLVQSPMHPQLRQGLKEQSEAFASLFPPIGNHQLIDVRWETAELEGKAGSIHTLTYQVGADDRWSIVNVQIFETDGAKLLLFIGVRPVDTNPTAGGEFEFENKGFWHFFWIFAMTTSIVTCIVGCVVAIKNRELRFRWFWALGSLLGYAGFHLNWGTGAVTFTPIYLLLFGASATKASMIAPWTLSFGLPVIASISIFLFMRRDRVSELAD